jgi:hypothetical protein
MNEEVYTKRWGNPVSGIPAKPWTTTRPRRFMRATVSRWASVQRPQPKIVIFAVLKGSRVTFR